MRMSISSAPAEIACIRLSPISRNRSLYGAEAGALGISQPYSANVRVRSEEDVMRLVMVHPTKSIEDLKEHAREAIRLRSIANTVTTAAIKARVLQQAEEHARLAGYRDRAA